MEDFDWFGLLDIIVQMIDAAVAVMLVGAILRISKIAETLARMEKEQRDAHRLNSIMIRKLIALVEGGDEG